MIFMYNVDNIRHAYILYKVLMDIFISMALDGKHWKFR